MGLILWLLLRARPQDKGTSSSEPSAPTHNLESLSERQQQVLSMASDGLSDTEIAQSLGLAPGTVSNHKRRGLERLGLAGVADLCENAHAQNEQALAEVPSRRPIVKAILATAAMALICIAPFISAAPGIAYCLAIVLGLLTCFTSALLQPQSRGSADRQSKEVQELQSSICAFSFVLGIGIALCCVLPEHGHRHCHLCIGFSHSQRVIFRSDCDQGRLEAPQQRSLDRRRYDPARNPCISGGGADPCRARIPASRHAARHGVTVPSCGSAMHSHHNRKVNRHSDATRPGQRHRQSSRKYLGD